MSSSDYCPSCGLRLNIHDGECSYEECWLHPENGATEDNHRWIPAPSDEWYEKKPWTKKRDVMSETNEDTRYCLIQDSDSHWYVCPADRADETQKQFQAIIDYWEEADYDKPVPEEPNYVQPVGGAPSNVTFTNPKVQ